MTVDRVAGVALVLIGLATLWESRAFPLGSLHRPGPAYMPVVLALLLIVFGVAAEYGLLHGFVERGPRSDDVIRETN